jgi:DNA-binding NarL/FixJ family response regulator
VHGRCILVVDDHEVVRAGLRSLLGRFDWVARCVGAGSGADALEVASRYEPHVALVDLCVGDESGLDISRSLLSAEPNVRILLMSGAGRVTPAVARAAGAYGFVAKDWTAGAMVEAVWLAASGRHVFARQEDDRVAAQALTARERDVLLHLARGLSNPEVASELNLSRHTVKQHTSAVYKKLGVRNRAEAASRAQRLGLVA